MKQRVLFATKYDYDRLFDLIRARAGSTKDAPHLRELQDELTRARIVDSPAIPADVVTMNSQVLLKDLETNEDVTYTLVFPEDANLEEDKISVLAPIGTAILGYRAGATVEWPVPAGVRKLRIEKVLYQPEAAGHFHL